MRTQDYTKLRDKQMEELNNFPITYAFDEKQLREALRKLNATKEECVTIFGHGDIVKKENAPKFIAMLERHTEEMKEAMQDKDFALAAFLYEMDNHEYSINYDGDGDVLGCFGMEMEDLEKLELEDVYAIARKKHFDHMREWGVL